MQNNVSADISLYSPRLPTVLAGLPTLIQVPHLQGFAKLVGVELSQARRFGTRPAVLLIDVEMREPLGALVQQEAQAAALLDALGARLRCRVRGSDVVACIGTRRFGVVLQNVERANVQMIQERLLRVLSGAYEVAPQPLYASLVSGIAKCECSRAGAAELTRAAELALGQQAPARQAVMPPLNRPHR